MVSLTQTMSSQYYFYESVLYFVIMNVFIAVLAGNSISVED